MTIPKTIYQTFKTTKLPLITHWHINRLKKKNPEYEYQFYDDARIRFFIKEEFGEDVLNLYDTIHIGAAKADFLGTLDSLILRKLDDLILQDDSAVISLENNNKYFIQYALFFESGHPFLRKTLDVIMENIKENKYPHEVHRMTGPSAFTQAVNECIEESNHLKYRQLGVDYDLGVKFSYRMAKTFLYGFSRKKSLETVVKTPNRIKIMPHKFSATNHIY